jgi:heme/copper-type cytochrome/quinol oxidase subunit 2
MRLDHIAISAIEQVAGRLARRLLTALVMVVLAVIAMSYFVSAGETELTARFGILNAQLIMGATFSGAALIALVVLWTMRAKPAKTTTPALSGQREMQLVMLVEAVMLGYALARKGERAR